MKNFHMNYFLQQDEQLKKNAFANNMSADGTFSS